MVQGNMSLMNGNINMRQASRDNSLVNNRSIAPTMPYQSPDVTSMGKLQGNTGSNLYSNIQLDRNSPEILSSLKSNPYAMNVASKL
jgi:PBP1b-binding outer membrane lipoprotein LpoB